MLSRSIRWRLQSWHTLILALLLVGFGITAYQLQPTDRLRRVDDELNEAITLLSPAARPPPSVLPPDFVNKGANFYLSGNISRFFEVSQASGLYYVVWLADGSVQARSPNAPAEVPKPKRLGPDRWQSARMRGSLREVFRFTPMDRCLVVGRSVEKEFAALQRLAWWLAAAGGGGLAIGFAGGWWAATRAIQPLQDIIATAAKITDPSQRVSTSDEGNEVVRLAAVLNSTFERLEAAFARQKQFTGDAAHELRTPITVIISEAQTVLSWDREPAEYRESLDACLTAAQQMRRLTESLLHLARSDFGQELPRSEIDLASLA